MILWTCCTQYASKLRKLISGHRNGKAVFILIPEKGNAQKCSNYCRIVLNSHDSKIILKIFQARLQCVWVNNFQMYTCLTWGVMAFSLSLWLNPQGPELPVFSYYFLLVYCSKPFPPQHAGMLCSVAQSCTAPCDPMASLSLQFSRQVY